MKWTINDSTDKYHSSLWSMHFSLHSMNLKFGTQRFLGSLIITNLSLTLKNSQLPMQCRGPKFKKFRDWKKILPLANFWDQAIFSASYLLGIIVLILDKVFRILIFWLQIRNQQPQRSCSTKFHPNQVIFLDVPPPYSICHSKFLDIELGFVMSDLASPRVPIFNAIIDHQLSTILNLAILTSDL